MSIRQKIVMALVGLVVLVVIAQPRHTPAPLPVTFASAKLAIMTRQGTVPFTVEIADTDAEREYGLMFRKTIPNGQGMLFDFKTPQRVTMWMKNTLAPLDMIFVSNSGAITYIAENATPESLNTITSGTDDTRAVIEVAGGTAARDHIAKGDKVLYSIFP